MARKLKTISVTPEQEQFIEENNLSPSLLIQAKVQEMMELSQVTGEQLKEEIRKREIWQETARKLRAFVERKGLMNEFLKEEGY